MTQRRKICHLVTPEGVLTHRLETSDLNAVQSLVKISEEEPGNSKERFQLILLVTVWPKFFVTEVKVSV